MSLRTRILLLVLFATLIPDLVLGVYFLNERNRNIERAKNELGALAKYAAENLDNKIKGTVQLLHGLSRAPDLDTAKAACSEFLAGVLILYPQYTGLLTITPNGALHCDSLRSGRTLDLNSREYFIEARTTREPAFEVVVGGLTGIVVLQVAYPASDADGVLKYILLASLNLSQNAREISAASQYRPLTILIWNRNGKLMLREPTASPSSAIDAAAVETALARFAAEGDKGSAAELPDIDGVQRVWAVAPLSVRRGGNARIALGVPTAVLTVAANRSFRNALLVLLGVSLLAFAGAWFVAEAGIRRHLLRITRVTGRLGAGELSARIGAPYPRGELGELMAAVDQTAGAVETQQEEIEQKSRGLETVNRTLRLLSGINALIVRVREPSELFDESCRIAVEAGGFSAALIAIADRDTGAIEPVAAAAHDPALAHSLKQAFGQGANNSIAARVQVSRMPEVADFSQIGEGGGSGTESAPSAIRAMAVLPLVTSGEAIGVLALYAADRDRFTDAELSQLMGLARDVAFAIDHLDKQERLNYLAYYDVLTGLANRGLLHERMASYLLSATSGGHKLALFLLDIERFKNINDTLGQPAGDMLLKLISEWLTNATGDANFVARIGGDRFAVMLPDVKQDEEVARLLKKITDDLAEHPFQLDGSAFRIAAKIGVALFPEDGADADILFRHAETALKKAKETSERYLFFARPMTKMVAGRLALENQLREALEQGEFVLHYQPKVNLASGKVTSAEALIRWNNPQSGLVFPGDFIPVLEETGLILGVGRWVLRTAIADHLRWRAAGYAPLRIAVNVSPLQLRDDNFIDDLRAAIGVTPDGAEALELEITEGMIMNNMVQTIASLHAIRAMGVRIAIDDFGTGFSSLSYLSRLPLDTLKIDRSFIVDMTVSPQGLALVSTIVTLAHSLRLSLVAEGVETDEQSRLLHLLGCDEMQGYVFSKAVPVETFESKFLSAPIR